MPGLVLSHSLSPDVFQLAGGTLPPILQGCQSIGGPATKEKTECLSFEFLLGDGLVRYAVQPQLKDGYLWAKRSLGSLAGNRMFNGSAPAVIPPRWEARRNRRNHLNLLAGFFPLQQRRSSALPSSSNIPDWP